MRIVAEGEDDVTERINREALDRLRSEFDNFEALQRAQSVAMREAIEQLQDSQDTLVKRVDDHDVDVRLLKTTVASTDGRLARIEAALVSTPRRALVAAGAPGGVWLMIEFVNWLRHAAQ